MRYLLFAQGNVYPRIPLVQEIIVAAVYIPVHMLHGIGWHAFDELEELSKKLPGILTEPGPVFVAMKVHPEIENKPIGQRSKWMRKTREQAIADLKQEVAKGERAAV